MSTLKVNQIQNLNGDVLLSSSGSDANLTLTGELRGPSTLIIDPAVIGNNTGTVEIKGNLTVQGTQTTINSTTMTVDDLNITLASGAANASAANGAGITIDGASATLTYQSDIDAFEFNKRVNFGNTNNIYIDHDAGSASPSIFLNRPTLPNTSTGTSILFDTIGVNYGAGADDGNGGTTPYTASALMHFRARPGANLHSDVTLTTQYGFYADDDLDNAVTNYGFFANIAETVTGSTRWGFYSNGSAHNWFKGKTHVGTGGNITTADADFNVFGDSPIIRITDTDTVLSDNERSSGLEFYQSDASGKGVSSAIYVEGSGSTGLTSLNIYTGGAGYTITKTGHGLSAGGTYVDDNNVSHTVDTVIDANSFTINQGTQAPEPAAGDSAAADLVSRLTVDSNGKVGIGTKSPSYQLTVVGNKATTGFSVDGRSWFTSDHNWNYSSIRIEREGSNTTNTKLISFLLDGDTDGNTDLYAYPNIVLRTNAAPTTGSTSEALAAKLEITAPAGVNLGVGSKAILTATPFGVDINGTLRESTDNGASYHNVVTAQDIGNNPNQVPLNQFLGQLAFLDEVGDIMPSNTDPQQNYAINFEYVSNTSIKIRMRGSDGTVRETTLTLS